VIIDLPDTTVSQVARRLIHMRAEGGAVALGRVLTLVVKSPLHCAETAIEAANDASREHPMRVIVLVADPGGEARLDAQIRVGGAAGASEVVVLQAYGPAATNVAGRLTGLLQPPAPGVAWGPDEAPEHPGTTALGRIAQRRITDTSAAPNPPSRLRRLDASYTPGDTDLAWTRLTRWREQLAAVLDQPPYEPVTAVEVRGASSSPSTVLLAAWLGLALDIPVAWHAEDPAEWDHGIHAVRLARPGGDIVLARRTESTAVLTQPGQPDHELDLPRRSLRECIAEELRRLDPDVLYGRLAREGLARLAAELPDAA
jgi:glucose-6-phosphate dehydrogenase assembly protein OpcA